MNDNPATWAHVAAVTRPALLLADPEMLDEVTALRLQPGSKPPFKAEIRRPSTNGS